MVYDWKIKGIYSVDAQTAGEELSRIYEETGSLEPSKIVDESRDENAPLHPCFEWDDYIAAEKYREKQAEGIVRCLVTVVEDEERKDTVRAFVHVKKEYHPIDIVISNEDMTKELLEVALRELRAFKRKYETLSELKPVFDAIDDISA